MGDPVMIYKLLLFFLCTHNVFYGMNVTEQFCSDAQSIGKQFKDKNFRRHFWEKTGYVPLCINKNNDYLCVLKNKYHATTKYDIKKTPFSLKIITLDTLKNKPLNQNLIYDPEPTSMLYPEKACFNTDGSLLFVYSKFINGELSVHKNPLFKEQISNNTRTLIGGTIEKNKIEHFKIEKFRDFILQTDPITKIEYLILIDNTGIISYPLIDLVVAKKHCMQLFYSACVNVVREKNKLGRRMPAYLQNNSFLKWLYKKAPEFKKEWKQSVSEKKISIFGNTEKRFAYNINNYKCDITFIKAVRQALVFV